MATNNQNTKLALFAFLFGAGLLNLSNLPGFNEAAIMSTDLSSECNSSAFDQKVNASGAATCTFTRSGESFGFTVKKEQKEVAGQIKDVYVLNSEGDVPSDHRVLVDDSDSEGRFDADCQDCNNGYSTATEARKNGMKLAEKIAAKIKKQKALEQRIEKCQVEVVQGNNGKDKIQEITGEARMKCLVEKLKDQDSDQTASYYTKNIREEVQALLSSNSIYDRQLGMATLAEIGKGKNLNCQSRPGLPTGEAAQNRYLSHANNSPVMNSAVPTTFANFKSDQPRDLVRESVCDLWAFGTYHNNLKEIAAAADMPNADRVALARAGSTLQRTWGKYFTDRNILMNQDFSGLGNLSMDLNRDVIESKQLLDENMKTILAQHKDILEANKNNITVEAGKGRQARGGVLPANPVVSGTPATNAWGQAQLNGAGVPGQVIMQPSQRPRTGGAPLAGTPVR